MIPSTADRNEIFMERLQQLRRFMSWELLDALFVYGDEYRKENLRYVSNYWPLFERGAAVIGLTAEPIVLCAPEGQKVCEEMSVWNDIRVVPDFLCVTVPDTIAYPMAQYTSFSAIAGELGFTQGKKRLGVVGLDAMPMALVQTIETAFQAELVDANGILHALRCTKSSYEIACLARAAQIADTAYKKLLSSDIIGMTEIQAAGIIEAAARHEGAEHIIFNVFASGARTATIIGRPTSKIIENGDMIMCALAVQYEGYVATCEAPFAVGDYSDQTRRVIDVLIRASAQGLPYLKPDEPMKNFVRAVKKVFYEEGLEQYDIYPPLHGIGCAEAESPYPNENSEETFQVGMTVNTDISLFGLEGGSNRIEEGFVITESGAKSLSPFVRDYCEKWLERR